MEIRVKFIGSLRSAAGNSRLTLEMKKTVSLREAVKEIVNRHPKLKRALIDPELCDPRPNALILVNERDVSVLDGLETVLKDGDEVVFVPILHGG
jgi:molybdopterin synthase sulfur carrier subunit